MGAIKNQNNKTQKIFIRNIAGQFEKCRNCDLSKIKASTKIGTGSLRKQSCTLKQDLWVRM